MVKTITDSLLVGSITPQIFFELVYDSTTFLKQFHSDINQDDHASVPCFEHTGHRTVAFSIPMDAPVFIQKLIGQERIQVLEEQQWEVKDDGSIVVESCPFPQIAMASSFTSTVTLVLCPVGGGACRVEATVCCAACGPFGLTTAIESFMASFAQDNLTKFLNYCQKHIEDLRRNGVLEARTAAIMNPATPTRPQGVPQSGGGDGSPISASLLTTEVDGEAPPEEGTIEDDIAVQQQQQQQPQPPQQQENDVVLEDEGGSDFFDAPEVSLGEVMSAGADLQGMVLCLQYLSKRGEQSEALLAAMQQRLISVEAALAASNQALTCLMQQQEQEQGEQQRVIEQQRQRQEERQERVLKVQLVWGGPSRAVMLSSAAAVSAVVVWWTWGRSKR